MPAGGEARELRREVERTKRTRAAHSLRAALKKADEIRIIAEFKRASPSRGAINPDATTATVIPQYEKGGAAAISILTEPAYFGGTIDDLHSARALTSLPLLRKDFIVAESQIDEAYLAGADAVLLIVAALSDADLIRLRRYAEERLGLDALVEAHSSEEMKRAAESGARIIGVNNRDLQNLTTSLAISEKLASQAPEGSLLVSESGLGSAADLHRLRKSGFHAFLIGTSLMQSRDPIGKLRSLRQESSRRTQLKVCGITTIEDALLAAELGVEMIGLNFSPVSARCLRRDEAAQIVDRTRQKYPQQKFIGIFVDQASSLIEELTRELKLDGCQLHGHESPDFVRDLKSPYKIKALAVDETFSNASLQRFLEADAILLDASIGRGGTGQRFDWARVENESTRPIFLAGGLTPENVTDAITAVRPFAIDVCSGIEDAPGKKNRARLEQLVAQVRGCPA